MSATSQFILRQKKKNENAKSALASQITLRQKHAKDMLQLKTSQFALGIFKHAKSVLIIPLPRSPTIEIFGKKIKRYVLYLVPSSNVAFTFGPSQALYFNLWRLTNSIISTHHWG
jgi:hypothetical protein